MRRILLFLVAVSLVGTGCGGATTESAAPRPETAPDTPRDSPSKERPEKENPPADPAPDFTVETFEGERFSLGEQKGTPVVLNFWESW